MGQDLINLNLNIPFIIPRSVFSINVNSFCKRNGNWRDYWRTHLDPLFYFMLCHLSCCIWWWRLETFRCCVTRPRPLQSHNWIRIKTIIWPNWFHTDISGSYKGLVFFCGMKRKRKHTYIIDVCDVGCCSPCIDINDPLILCVPTKNL